MNRFFRIEKAFVDWDWSNCELNFLAKNVIFNKNFFCFFEGLFGKFDSFNFRRSWIYSKEYCHARGWISRGSNPLFNLSFIFHLFVSEKNQTVSLKLANIQNFISLKSLKTVRTINRPKLIWIWKKIFLDRYVSRKLILSFFPKW